MDLCFTERHLAAIAVALGAEQVRGLSPAESALSLDLPHIGRDILRSFRIKIEGGKDPLGDALCALRSPEERRPRGATYTPRPIVTAMIRWAASMKRPVARIVDPGVGSARFLVAAGRRLTDARLVGDGMDPLAALLARAHIAAASFAKRSEIVLGDFRTVNLSPLNGPTLFIGNPPYVRHHLIEPEWKEWLARTAKTRGL